MSDDIKDEDADFLARLDKLCIVKPLSDYDDDSGSAPAPASITLSVAAPTGPNSHLPEGLRRFLGSLLFDNLSPQTKLSLYRRWEAGEFDTPAAQEAPIDTTSAAFRALPPEERLRAGRRAEMNAGVSRVSTTAADKLTAESRASLSPRWNAAGGIERQQLVNAEARKLAAEREVGKLRAALPSLSGALRASTEARIAHLLREAGL